MWVFFGLFSALFLGFYDALRKKVLHDNAVFPVLFFASFTGAILFLPLIIGSTIEVIEPGSLLYVPGAGAVMHLRALLKSVIVGSSWFLAYNAISRLPLTIVIPIRSTGPMWTLIGALLIFSERLSAIQWVGIAVVLGFFYYFTLAGRREGFSFLTDKWIFAAIGATLLGAVSSMYDKFLFSQFDRMFIQAWYSVYMVPVLLPVLLFIWYPKRAHFRAFSWSFFIPVIGIILVVSDWLYFYGLSQEGALIAVLAIIRRTSVVISFAAGAVFFGETNLKRKGIALLGILIGVTCIVLGTLWSA